MGLLQSKEILNLRDLCNQQVRTLKANEKSKRDTANYEHSYSYHSVCCPSVFDISTFSQIRIRQTVPLKDRMVSFKL